MGKFGTLLVAAALAGGCADRIDNPAASPEPTQRPHPSMLEKLDTAIRETCQKCGDAVTAKFLNAGAMDSNVLDRAAMSAGFAATSECLDVGAECERKGDTDRATVLSGTTNVDSWVEDLSVRVGTDTAIRCMAAAGYKVEQPPVEGVSSGDGGHTTVIN